MQITLTQADIEAAILSHLATKLKFEEGFTPTVEIKATRGPEGFTAIIDLDDEKSTTKAPRQPRNKPEKAPEQEPAGTKAESAQPAATEAAQEGAGEQAGDTATEASEQSDVAAQATDAAQPEQSGEADAEADGKTEDGAVPDKPKSLFAGLAKPKNS